MNDQVQMLYAADDHALAAQRNRVLRNTYGLLAVSLVPTVLGAWVGVSTGISQAMGGGLAALLFLAGAFAFMFAIEKTKESATLGFNGIDPAGKVSAAMLRTPASPTDRQKLEQLTKAQPNAAEHAEFVRQGGLKQR